MWAEHARKNHSAEVFLDAFSGDTCGREYTIIRLYKIFWGVPDDVDRTRGGQGVLRQQGVVVFILGIINIVIVID